MKAALWKVFVQVILFCLAHLGLTSSRNDSVEDECTSLLPVSYDRNSPPKHQGNPANIFVQIEVLDLDEINEETMDFRLHAFIRAVWEDPRLLPNYTRIRTDCVNSIWTPDMIFKETKLIIETGQHNVNFVLRKDHLYLSQRYSFKVACMMNFQRYPFDTQHCIFSISFMSSGDDEAVLKWFDDEYSPYRSIGASAIVLEKKIDPLQFIILTPTTHSTVNIFMFNNYTLLLANFTLSRRLTGSIVNYYMPSALLVVVSWITFWLQEDAASERVTLTMTALLTICTQSNQYKSELPPVNYITAMDIWFFVCIFMIFATLVEYAFSYRAYRKKQQAKSLKVKKIEAFKESATSGDDEIMTPTSENLEAKMTMITRFLQMDETIKLDSICKVLFPSFFVLFFVIYWIYYLYTSS